MMTTRKAAVVLSLLVWTVAVHSAEKPANAPGEKFLFKRFYPTGQYTLTQKVNTDQVIVTGEMEMKQKISMTMVLGINVGKPNASGDREMVLQFRRVTQRTQMGEMVMAYDSNLPDEKQMPMAAVWRPLLKAKIKALISPDGKVKKFSGLNEVWDALAKQQPASAQMIGPMKEQFGDAMVQQMIARSYEVLPTKAIGVGESWASDDKIKLPFVGQIKVAQQFKAKAVEKTPAGKVVVIDTTGTVKTDKPAKTTMGPAEVTILKMDMTQKGQSRYNADLGIFVGQTIRQRGTMQMSVGPAEGAQQSMTIKQDTTIEMITAPDKPGKEQPTRNPA